MALKYFSFIVFNQDPICVVQYNFRKEPRSWNTLVTHKKKYFMRDIHQVLHYVLRIIQPKKLEYFGTLITQKKKHSMTDFHRVLHYVLS